VPDGTDDVFRAQVEGRVGVLRRLDSLAAGPAPTPTAGKRIALDPGHGGFESGAAQHGLVEKQLNLDVALRLRELLRADGHRVVLTRETDSQVNTAGRDLNGDGRVDTDDDLQARVDVSNEAGADVFVSIHANGGSPAMRGLATYYCAACEGAARHRALGRALHDGMLAALQPHGAGQFGAGLFDEATLGKPYGHLFVNGPKTPRVARPNQAPAHALVEMLFISNARDAALLAQDGVRDALAAGLRRGLQQYLAQIE
jgi:N-acetylmuramoyl-L-alanine amidase